MGVHLPPWATASSLVLLASMAVAARPGDGGVTGADLTRPSLAEPVLPVVRERVYVVNGRVRPLLLFWIGRNDIGNARVTWRANGRGRHTLELLVGSDPARAPRKINRWGYLREEFTPDGADVLGVMKASNEETLDEATTRVASEQDGVSTFKAVRTTIRDRRALGGTITLTVPNSLTYHELDTVLAMIPAEPSVVKSTAVPHGVMSGFLVAMETMLRASIEPCLKRAGRTVQPIAYLYNQKLYDLSMRSCSPRAELRTAAATYADVIDGRFQVRNRISTEVTSFAVTYGTAGELSGQPVRIEFRPRWWIEVELLLHPAAAGRR
jgi:hypothetical protein